MCLLPGMAAGLIKPKTAALGLVSPAAAIVSALKGKGGKKKPVAPAGTMETAGTPGPSPSYGG
jgi:hypothetical protein